MKDTRRLLREQHFLRRLREKDASLWSGDPSEQAKIRNRLGWMTAHEAMGPHVEDLKAFAAEMKELGYRQAVLLGMGGSSLAPEVFKRTFSGAEEGLDLIVLDTTDPAAILDTERRLDMERTAFIVSSKSGTTIETLSLFRYFGEKVRETRDGGPLDNFVAITDPGTPLEKQAEREGFNRVFLNPEDIGGRYSALSLFGLVPATLVGVDIERLLERAASLDDKEAVELGARLFDNWQSGRDKITFLATPGLESFGVWAEQLLAESTGKRGKGLVPIVGEPVGVPSVYGEDRAFVHLRFKGQDRQEEALRVLEAAGHPVLEMEIDDQYGLGAEFLRWEIATAAVGALMEINPFDEPNVQESKQNTTEALEEYNRSRRLAEGEPLVVENGLAVYGEDPGAAPSSARSMASLLRAHLERAHPGDYVAIMAYIQPKPEHDNALQLLRLSIRDGTRLATTLGYGPRFLHSTGQLHKGGPDKAVFIQLTADDPQDAPIPGEPGYGFSALKRAQALGDWKALQRRGRRILRVHLGRDARAGLDELQRAMREALAKPVQREG